MKTLSFFRIIPKGLTALFVIILIIFSGCTQDDLKLPVDEAHNTETGEHINHYPKYDKRKINFSEFKYQLNDHIGISGTEGKFTNDLSFIRESEYIVAIDTSRIIEFSNDSLATYTFNVTTTDQTPEIFTNLIVIEMNDEISYGFVRYTPSTEWIDAKINGEDIIYTGDIDLIDERGTILTEGNGQGNKMGTSGGTASKVECIFSAEPIIEPCYGSSCPCTDGNGILVGWNFTILCTNWSGGSTGTGTGNNGGNGSGGSGGGTNGGNGMDLPTDPLAWDLFFNLHDMAGPNDYFYFDEEMDPNTTPLVFNTFQDFEDDYNSFELDVVNVIQESDQSTTSHYGFRVTPVTTVDVFVNQNLKDASNNQDYLVNSVTTSLSGVSLGRVWEVTSINIEVDPANERAHIHVYGLLHYDSFTETFGLYYSRFFHLIFTIDTTTGENHGVSILEE